MFHEFSFVLCWNLEQVEKAYEEKLQRDEELERACQEVLQHDEELRNMESTFLLQIQQLTDKLQQVRTGWTPLVCTTWVSVDAALTTCICSHLHTLDRLHDSSCPARLLFREIVYNTCINILYSAELTKCKEFKSWPYSFVLITLASQHVPKWVPCISVFVTLSVATTKIAIMLKIKSWRLPTKSRSFDIDRTWPNQLLLPKKALKIRNTPNYASTKTKRSSHCSNAWRACVRCSFVLISLSLRQCRRSDSIYIFMCFSEYASCMPQSCSPRYVSQFYAAFSHLIHSTYCI